MAHSLFSPSAAHRWTRCAGSVVLEQDYPDTGGKYADEGTAAHTVASWVLQGQAASAAAYIGRQIDVCDDDGTVRGTYECTEDMARHVQSYVDFVREQEATGLQLLVESRVSFGKVCGIPVEDNPTGTADAILFGPKRIVVCDLKYGAGVLVDAEDNDQLKLYAIGALELLGMLGEDTSAVEEVTLVICQPRHRLRSEPSLWRTTVRELQAYSMVVLEAYTAAKTMLQSGLEGSFEPVLTPGEKQCQWCKAKATCPALAAEVIEHVSALVGPDSFDDLTQMDKKTVKALVGVGDAALSSAMAAADLIEDFVKAVRAEVERRLLAGTPVTGFKLVEGRKGARAWRDEAAAEALLKSFRLKHDEMYKSSLISAVQAIELFKDQPRRLPKIEALVTQTAGKPSVAPASSSKPEWSPLTFDDLTAEELC